MANMGLISLGVLLIITAMSVLAFSANILLSPLEIMLSIIALFGCWMIILAGIRRRNPSKYERGALSTFAWGLLLTIIGLSSILSLRGLMTLLYTVAAVLLVIGILAIAVAIEKR